MHLFMLLALFVGALTAPSLSAAEEVRRKTPTGVPRVRAADSRVAAVFNEGLERSASFRAIVDRINTLDVIVYLETQPTLRGRLSGAMTWVTKARDFRYLRVSLNPHLSSAQLVASLAHELQHVIEVGEAPSIVDTRTLSEYYRVAGLEKRVHSDDWETAAAQRTGDVVRRELASSYDAGVAQSIQAQSIQVRPLDLRR